MVLLSTSKKIALFLASVLALQACGPSVTLVSYVDTDTYISSTDSANHSELATLNVSNTGGSEERPLLKLPTGQEDTGFNFGEVFGNLKDPVTWPLAPFVIILDIFASFFNCANQVLAPLNLISANLVLNVNQNPSSAPLTQLSIRTLAKPWWQTVNWTQAFPFSGAGAWTDVGGDTDPSFTAIPATTTTPGEIHFDVTAYFRAMLVSQNQPHYGFMMRSSSPMAQVLLDSVQATNSANRPRLVSQYNCTAPVTSAVILEPSPKIQPFTFYLGKTGR